MDLFAAVLIGRVQRFCHEYAIGQLLSIQTSGNGSCSMRPSHEKRNSQSLLLSAALHFAGLGLALITFVPSINWQVDGARGNPLTMIFTQSEWSSNTSSDVEFEHSVSEQVVEVRNDAQSLPDTASGKQQRSRITDHIEVLLEIEVSADSIAGQRVSLDESSPVVVGIADVRRHKIRRPVDPATAIATVEVVLVANLIEGTLFDEPPTKLPNNKPPDYPREARNRGDEGRVSLLVLVDENGHVKKLRVDESSGHAVLDQSALMAVSNWKFAPGKQRGRSVAVEILVPIRFSVRSS